MHDRSRPLRVERRVNIRNLEQLLSAIRAFEQAHQRSRRVLKPLDDIFALFDLALTHPVGQTPIGSCVILFELMDQESLDRCLGEDDVEIVAWPRRHLAGIARIGIISGDATAYDDSRPKGEPAETISQAFGQGTCFRASRLFLA